MILAFPLPMQSRELPVTWAQAQEIGRLFHEEFAAVPTIAHRMSIPYDTCCAVLAGKVWPGSRRYWMDRVLPCR